jgi:hypothetical protein
MKTKSQGEIEVDNPPEGATLYAKWEDKKSGIEGVILETKKGKEYAAAIRKLGSNGQFKMQGARYRDPSGVTRDAFHVKEKGKDAPLKNAGSPGDSPPEVDPYLS